MNDGFRMGCLQCVGYLNAQHERLRNIERLAADLIAQRLSVEKLHDQEWMTLRLTHVVNGANIGMVER
jgi:hypothetical protein